MSNKFNRSHLQHQSPLKRTVQYGMMLVAAITLSLLGGCACSGQSCPSKVKPQQMSIVSPLVLEIDVNGQISCEGQTCELQQVDTLMSQLAKDNPDRQMLLKCPKELQFAKAVQIMSSAKQAGFTQVSIATSNTKSEL